MLQTGDQIDAYEILEHLGSGAVGSVYSAKSLELDRRVAIKVLDEKVQSSGTVFQRFKREAVLASKLDHPNIVRALSFGVNGARPYIVYAHEEGTTLAGELNRRKFSDQEVVDIFIQLARALQLAHDNGIVHRDIKPSNILIAANSVPKILDFGAARIESSDQDLTQTADIVGTPLYMSPEQCRGGAVDGRSDLYSLGCVLYEVLSGKPPFAGAQPMEIVLKHTQEQVPPIGGTSPDSLKKIAYKLLSKSPDHRYASGGALAEALRGAELTKTEASKTRRLDSRTLSACILLALSTIGIMFVLKSRRVPDVTVAMDAMSRALQADDYDKAQAIFDQSIRRKEYSPKQLALIERLVQAQIASGHRKQAHENLLAEADMLEHAAQRDPTRLLAVLQELCLNDLIDNSCDQTTVGAANRSVQVAQHLAGSKSEYILASPVMFRAMVYSFVFPGSTGTNTCVKEAQSYAQKYEKMLNPPFLAEFKLRCGVQSPEK